VLSNLTPQIQFWPNSVWPQTQDRSIWRRVVETALFYDRHVTEMMMMTMWIVINEHKLYKFITQCIKATSGLLHIMGSRCTLTRRAAVLINFVVHVIGLCAKLEPQVLKVGRFSIGWFALAARLVRAHLYFWIPGCSIDKASRPYNSKIS